MRDRPLAELVARVRRPIIVNTAKEYAEIGVRSHGKGIFHKEPVTGAELGAKRVFEIKPGDLVFNIVFAWEGAVAVAGGQEQGRCGSHRFPTYRPLPGESLVEYLNLFFQTPAGRELLVLSSPGSAGRNRTLNQEKLLASRIPAPPINEQRRIVDLVGAADSVTDCARAMTEASRSAIDVVLSDWRQAYTGPVARLGDLADMGSGPSWKADNERLVPLPGDTRVLGIVNTPTSGAIDLREVKYVGGLTPRVGLLSDRSLLMIRTNGNRSRIGNVYRVPPKAYGCAFSAFQIGIHMRDSNWADFAYWMLRAPDIQRAISENASGSTGLGNIAIRWLKEIEIPWPSATERESVVALLDSLEQAATAASREYDAARTARTALLRSVVSGEHDIPASYDALLEQA